MGDAVAPIRSVAALHMPAWVEMQPYNRDLGCLHSQVMAARSLSNPLCCLSLEILDNRQTYNDNLYTAGLLKTTFLCTLTLVGKNASCCVAYPDKREHGTRTSERRRNRKKQHRKNLLLFLPLSLSLSLSLSFSLSLSLSLFLFPSIVNVNVNVNVKAADACII